MKPFRIHEGLVAPLDRANVDTDQIIPKQFLKRTERTGFGDVLFYDWRYDGAGRMDPSFVLNDKRYQKASILVTGKNFGCGSSREHAPWALADYGFRAIVAPSFADIFYNNCLKNGLLPVVLVETEVNEIMGRALRIPGYRLKLNLEDLTARDRQGLIASFEIDEFRRRCLLEGLDEIGLTLQYEGQIASYEASRQMV